MLFSELPELERPAAAASCGFRTIECWWPSDPATWTERVGVLAVRVASVNAPEATPEGVRAGAQLASAVGAPAVNLPLASGPEPSLVRELAELAREAGLVLLVEPLNAGDAPGYPVRDADAAARFIDAVGSDAVRLLFDAYHSAEEGRRPTSDVRTHADLIAHVQYADSPGRGAPGTGRSDLWDLIDTLQDVGYDGAVGLEYWSPGPTADTLGFLEPERGVIALEPAA